MFSWAKLAVLTLVMTIFGTAYVARGEATTQPYAKGIITQVGDTSITLQTPHGDVTIKLGEATVIKDKGKGAKGADMKRGM